MTFSDCIEGTTTPVGKFSDVVDGSFLAPSSLYVLVLVLMFFWVFVFFVFLLECLFLFFQRKLKWWQAVTKLLCSFEISALALYFEVSLEVSEKSAKNSFQTF